MAKKKLTEEQLKEIQFLKAQKEMYDNTIEEAKMRGNEKGIERIRLAQEDTIQQIKNIDPSLVEEDINESNSNDFSRFLKNQENDEKPIIERIKAVKNDVIIDEEVKEEIPNEVQFIQEAMNNVSFNNDDMDVAFDVIALPSNGECYPTKNSRLQVGFLTSADENVITSPQLYKDGSVIDLLLHRKVLTKGFNVDDLCVGDCDAITVFLRATSYGADFPIFVKDPQSGENIETTVDLTKLKSKPFTLKGDENGHFEFQLPISKDVIKFKFLTRKDERNLKLLGDLEDKTTKAAMLQESVNLIKDLVKNDAILTGREKQDLTNGINKLTPWVKRIQQQKNLPYNHMITNRLEMCVMAVNGNYDKNYISKYVKNMVAMDSLMLRRYINDNEPGINFEVEIERPESLGGGSFTTFLEWEDSVFLNFV